MPTPPRKTNAFRIYAAPVALLLMAGVLAPSQAAAEPMRNVKMVQTTFRFDPEAPAARIYADLTRTVERLCTAPGPRPGYMRRHDQACMAEAMTDAVAKIGQIGRTDIARHHAANG